MKPILVIPLTKGKVPLKAFLKGSTKKGRNPLCVKFTWSSSVALVQVLQFCPIVRNHASSENWIYTFVHVFNINVHC